MFRCFAFVLLAITAALTACGLGAQGHASSTSGSPTTVTATAAAAAGGQAGATAAVAGPAAGTQIRDGLTVVPGTRWDDQTINVTSLYWTTNLVLTGDRDQVAEAYLQQMLAMGMRKYMDETTTSTQSGLTFTVHSVGARWAEANGAPMKVTPDNIDQFSVDVTTSNDGRNRVKVMGHFKPK
jgi:hypothetical protein